MEKDYFIVFRIKRRWWERAGTGNTVRRGNIETLLDIRGLECKLEQEMGKGASVLITFFKVMG